MQYKGWYTKYYPFRLGLIFISAFVVIMLLPILSDMSTSTLSLRESLSCRHSQDLS